MGFLNDLWEKAKDVGKWIGGFFLDFSKGLWHLVTSVAGLALGWVVVGLYYAWLATRNINKNRVSLSPCLIDVIKDLFHGDVDLSKVGIIVNASGVVNAGAVTRGHTIYWEGDFDLEIRLRRLLHELHHTQQYTDWGYFKFATLYTAEAVYYLSHDDMPIEIAAATFAENNLKTVRDKYDSQCKGLPIPPDVVLEEEAERPGDWTVLLGLI